MRRHTKCNNVVLLAVGLEFFEAIAIMAVNDAGLNLTIIHKRKPLANNLSLKICRQQAS